MGSHPGVSKVEGAMHHWVMPTLICGALLLSLVLTVIAALRGAWAGVLVLTSAALVLAYYATPKP